MYYMYCIKMRRTEQEFWESTHRKITHLIDMYADEATMKACAMEGEGYESKYFSPQESQEAISSMKEVEGFV